MLRLDVNAPPPFIPADNPFLGDPGVNDEIWALGLRNPWRYSFDRLTGDLFIADVGQGDVEEIDFQPRSSTGGENYGWRCMEGSTCTGSSDAPAPITLVLHPRVRPPAGNAR
jgi:glucose/arabinose dehydrogenase